MLEDAQMVTVTRATLMRAHPLRLDLAEFRRWIQLQSPERHLRTLGPQGVVACYLLEKRRERWTVELSLAAPIEYPDAVQSLPRWTQHLHRALGSMGYAGATLVPAQQVAHLLRTVVLGGDDDEEEAQ